MKDNPLAALVTMFGLTLAAAGMLAVWLLRETLMVLATVLVAGIVAAMIIAATALPIRAWRKNDAAPVVREIRETRIFNDAFAPKQFMLPPPREEFRFPEIIRAGYQAGLMASHGNNTGVSFTTSTFTASEEPAFRPEDEWGGDISVR